MAYYAQPQYAPPPPNVIVMPPPIKRPDCLTRTCCCCCLNSSLARRFNTFPLLGKLCCLIPLILILLVIIIVAVLLIYVNVGVYQPSGTADALFASIQGNPSANVTYTTLGSTYIFTPSGNSINSTIRGLVLLPEFKADYEAYVPLAVNIASQGYLVALVSPPLHFPPFALGRIDSVINAYPSVTKFAVGGHGIGANTAAAYVLSAKSSSVRGVFLMAPYSGASLSTSSLESTVVYGTKDGLVSSSDIQNIQGKFPSNAVFVKIDGANHSQFGSFLKSINGDLPADIPEGSQQDQATQAAAALLQRM